MDLRDYLAGQALAGILASTEGLAGVETRFNPVVSTRGGYMPVYRMSLEETAYDIADAMIAQRERRAVKADVMALHDKTIEALKSA